MNTLMLPQLIGNTRIVYAGLHNTTPLYIKLEGDNPTGSLKDRVAHFMLSYYAGTNALLSGKTLIDASSGSFGCALAYFCRLHGVQAEIIANTKAGATHVRFMELMGARVTRHGNVTREGYEYIAELLSKHPEQYLHTDQLNSPLAMQAHMHTLAPEILRDVPDVGCVVCSMGSGATALGLCLGFQMAGRNIPVYVSTAKPGRKIPGTYLDGEDFETVHVRRLREEHRLLGETSVGYDEAREESCALVTRGYPVGIQTGGVLLAAKHAIEQHTFSSPVVCISGDNLFKAPEKLTD